MLLSSNCCFESAYLLKNRSLIREIVSLCQRNLEAWVHRICECSTNKRTKTGVAGFLFMGSVVFLLGLTISVPAWGDGFRNPFQDSAAIAQGNAFRAQADNPSAIHYNPAGMTQLEGVQHAIGVQFVNVNTKFQSASGVEVENDLGGIVGLPPPGQLFITGNLQTFDIPVIQDVTLGLGVESLFGFANKYPKDGPFASAVTRAQLPLLDIKPTMAYKISERISLGLGVDVFTFASFLGEGHSEQQSIAVGNIPGTTPGQELELTGKGTTAGLNASILVTPWMHDIGKPMVNIGFVWRSQAVLKLKGELRADGQKVADAKTSLRFPESYEWGLAIWPIRNSHHEWKVEVDVDYVRWSSIRNFDIFLSNGVELPNPQNWSDGVTVGVGTEKSWLKPLSHPDWDYAVRGGYLRSNSPIPDQNFNPAFPDSDVNVITAGMGFLCRGNGKLLWLISCGDTGNGSLWRKAISLDLAYMALLWKPRKVDGNPNPGVNGRYKTITHTGSLTFRVKF